MLAIDGKGICGSCFADQTTDSEICGACGFDNSAAVENTGALPMGMVLYEKYVIGKVLGRGGFGITYLAYDKTNRIKVAIKEYFPDSLSYRTPDTVTITNYTGDKETYYKSGVEKFYSEAKILSRFNGNDHIINVTEFFYANNTAYYVMEYVNGVDLKKYISMKGGRLAYDEVLDILVPVMYALIIVHSIDVLHRDISPDNIYLTKDGDIKILDFGAARQVFGEQSNNLSVILKQGFTPIEQYRKRGNHGPWSDVYALGATVYYCLTGQTPEESVNRLEDDDLRMPSQLGFDVPADFEKILKKMLAVKAENRFQSMIELKEAMRSLNASSHSVSSADFTANAKAAPSPVKPEARQGGKPAGAALLAGGIGALAIIAAFALYFAFFRGAKTVADQPYVLITSAFRAECSYSGEWKNDAPNGAGTLTILEEVPYYWNEKTKITGTFTDGLIQGDGKYEDPNGNRYTGEFKNGLRSGQGAFILASGETQIGEFRNHFLNGNAKVVYVSGAIYEGDFVDGLSSGHGKCTYPNGSVYEGEFAHDLENGRGEYLSHEGWRYVGDFVNGDFHGNGIIYDADGKVLYDGPWENGETAGETPEETTDGTGPEETKDREVKDAAYTLVTSLFTVDCAYTGEWDNGMPNGRGSLVILEDGSQGDFSWFKGDTYSGNFTDGLLEGHGKYETNEGSWYEGAFTKGLYNGLGTFHSSDGFLYEGDFVNEAFEGNGVLTWDDGFKYEGEFEGGTFHGFGILTNEAGEEVFSGAWNAGEPIWDE